MIHKVDRVPDEIVNKEGEGVAEDKPSKIVPGDQLFFILGKIPELLPEEKIPEGTDAGENQGKHYELGDLLFQLLLQDVHLYDEHPHNMREEYPQQDEDPDPSKKKHPVVTRGDLPQRPVEEKVNKYEGAPATGLE